MDSSNSIAHEVSRNHDALRFGLPAVKGEIIEAHPLQSLIESSKKSRSELERKILASTYGSAFFLKKDLDRQILSRFQRPPGLLPSSMLGLEALTGDLDDFGFEDYLNDPRESETFRPAEMHHGMEVRLGLSKEPVCPSFM